MKAVRSLNPFGKAAKATRNVDQWVTLTDESWTIRMNLNRPFHKGKYDIQEKGDITRETWKLGKLWGSKWWISNAETRGCWWGKRGWDTGQRCTASAGTISREARTKMVALCTFSDRSYCHGLGISCVYRALQLPNATIKFCSLGNNLRHVSSWHGSTVGLSRDRYVPCLIWGFKCVQIWLCKYYCICSMYYTHLCTFQIKL